MTNLASAPSLVRASDVTPYQLWETEVDSAVRQLEKFHKRANQANRRYVDERDDNFQEDSWFNLYYANTVILESALYSQIPEATVTRAYEDYQDSLARVAALILQRGLQQDVNDPTDRFDSTMRQCVQDRLVAGLAVAWVRLETETEDIPDSEGGSLASAPDGQIAHADSSEGGSTDGFMLQSRPSIDQEPPAPSPMMGPAPQTPPGAPENPNGPAPVMAPPEHEIIPLKRIKEQRVVVDYVYWGDFLWSPCRVWAERRWIARKVYMTRDQLVERFGKDKGGRCQLNYTSGRHVAMDQDKDQGISPHKQVFQHAEVFEIWDRTTRKVIWYSKGLPELLDEKEDFLQLMDFEPISVPMFANITTQTTVPRPDYYMIRDQYDELDLVNARISKLVSACKVVGMYDQASKAVQNVFQGAENKMVPVENWGQFSEKGGMKGSVDWIPLDQVVAALDKLMLAREAIKAQVYELTGIADIVRGASKASETLGAQEIKAKFASIRIKKLQDEVLHFASSIFRVRAEIMSKHFTNDMLIRKSGIMYTDNQEFIAGAIALLKSEQGFKWYVAVSPDTLSQADYASEKQERVEFLSMVTGYLQQTVPLAMQLPEIKPIVLGLLKWGIAGFKRASDIEGMIDKQLSALEGKPPPPPKPDPKVQAAQMKAQSDQQKVQGEMQKNDQEMKIAQEEAQMDMQAKREELDMKREENQMDIQMKQMELQFKREEMGMKAQEHQQNLQATIQENQVDMETHQQKAAMDVQNSMVQNDMQRRQGEQELEMSRKKGEQDMTMAKKSGTQKMDQTKEEAKVKRSLLVKSNPGASKRQ